MAALTFDLDLPYAILTGEGGSHGFIDPTRNETHNVNFANEIVTRDVNGATHNFTYDAAGNLVSDGQFHDAYDQFHYAYDAWNRIRYVRELDATGAPGDFLAHYAYDALGRRVRRQGLADDIHGTHQNGDYFYYDGHRLIAHYRTAASGGQISRNRSFGVSDRSSMGSNHAG